MNLPAEVGESHKLYEIRPEIQSEEMMFGWAQKYHHFKTTQNQAKYMFSNAYLNTPWATTITT